MRRAELAVLLGLVVAGCAPPATTLVVVVPADDGHLGGVVVDAGGRQVVLDQPYAAAGTSPQGELSARTLSSEDVERTFAAARAAQPLRPVSFTLYFREGSDEFTRETRAVVDQIFAEIGRRSAAEVSVIGHTDTVGKRKDNDRLSRQRAERVRRDLVGLGIPPELIRAAGRGEREPLVATADEVAEPRNRRVEISVR